MAQPMRGDEAKLIQVYRYLSKFPCGWPRTGGRSLREGYTPIPTATEEGAAACAGQRRVG